MSDAEDVSRSGVALPPSDQQVPGSTNVDPRTELLASSWPWRLRLLSPPWLLLVSLALSACLWAIPWSTNIHTGYRHKLEITPAAGFVLGSWYLLIVVTGAVGFEVGRRLSPIAIFDEFPSRLYYRYFTVVGAIGVAYTYGTVIVHHPTLVTNAIQHQTFNQVHAAFGYGAGVQTLRYATIFGGGVALYEVCFRSRFTKLALFNLLLLAWAAAAASRLSLLMAILIAVGLAVKDPALVHRFWRRVLVIAVIGFVALTGFNYLRNANFYKEYYRTGNPLTMNLDESVAYLGAPFQASVATAKRAAGQKVEAVNEQLIPNPSFESDKSYWQAYDGGFPPTPTLGRVEGGPAVTSGRWALGVRMANPSSQSRDKYVWVTDHAAVQVAPGDRFLLRARVSGPASGGHPIRLGVRQDDGSVTQDGLTPLGSGAAITMRQTGVKRLLAGEYTATHQTSTIQLAIWKEIRPDSVTQIVVDDVSLVRRSTGPTPKPPLLQSLTAFLVPTYLQPHYRSVDDAEVDYRRYVTIEAILTTNSALAAMYGSLGTWWAFAVIGIACLIGAAFAGHASRYRSFFFLAVFVVSYVFAELWRVYLFNYGIIQFLLLFLILVPVCHPFFVAIRDRLRSWASPHIG